MPYQVDPRSGAVGPAPRDLPAEIFTDLDRLDDDQIVAELKGGVIEEYVYQFPVGGQQIVGLSWVGAREAARHYRGIHAGEPKIAQDDESFTIMVQMTDTMRDLSLWGAATVPKKMKTKNGEVVDGFAFNKALSKAQRNALVAVLPTAVIVKTIQAFLDAKKGVRQVSKPAAVPPEEAPRPPSPPARPAPRAPSRPPAAPPEAPENDLEPPDEDPSYVEEAHVALPNTPARQRLLKRWEELWGEAALLGISDVEPLPGNADEAEITRRGQELAIRIKQAKAQA